MSNPMEFEKHTALIENLVVLLPYPERDKARTLLMRSDNERLQLLTQLIAKERRKRRIISWTVAPALLLIGSGIMIANSDLFLANLALFLWLILGIGSLFLLLFSALTYLPTRLEKAAMEALLHAENEQNIGPLLDGWDLQTRSLRARTRASLIRLLPQLTLETFQRFTPTQRRSLCGLLNPAQRDSDQELRLAVLAALHLAGDRSCLGSIYLLAIGEATTPPAQTGQKAAIACLNHLVARLDFEPLQSLPRYIDIADAQMQAEEPNLPTYFTSILTLRQLLPQLTPANYRNIVSERHRSQLYRMAMLLTLRPPFHGKIYHSGMRDLQMDLVRTAERLGDVSAIKSFELFARNPPMPVDDKLHAAVCRALRVLTPLVEREKLGQTLLRGASAPDALPDELLRAAGPNATETRPDELLRASTPHVSLPSPASEEIARERRPRAETAEEA